MGVTWSRHVLIPIVAALVGGLVGSGDTAVAGSDEPDLVPLLPTVVDSTQVAPEYVDAFALPGRIVYRFDSVIWNQGGILELYRESETADVMQVVWPGGTPSSPPDPNSPPSDPSAELQSRGPFGAQIEYAFHGTHQHWHFLNAASYRLLVPGDDPRESPKVGFCLRDTYGAVAHYAAGGAGRWCKPGDSAAEFVGMGISSGAGDRYRSQVFDQWVDVTGLRPGIYVLEITVNPAGTIDEANTANNLAAAERVIPGTVAFPVHEEVARNGSATIRLTGAVVAPTMPARAAAACEPSPTSTSCYVTADPRGPLTFNVERHPAHGVVTLGAGEGLSAEAIYTPNPGYFGPDSFTYRVTDVRGLDSLPATVDLDVFGLTLASRRPAVVFGESVRLVGRVNGLDPGATVSVLAQRHGSGEAVRIGEVTADDLGKWTRPVRPRIESTYWAELRAGVSRKVTIGVRPHVALAQTRRGLVVRVAPRMSGRTVWLQRWNRSRDRWRFVERRRLNTNSVSVFAPRADGLVRAFIGGRAAGPGYLSGFSKPLFLRSPSPSR